MSKIRQNYDEDLKKNAVKLSCASPKTIKNFAADLGIYPSIIYNWRKIHTERGDKTRLAERYLRQFQLENAELKMENEMQKNNGLLCQTSEINYRFIQKNNEYPVKKWAAMLGLSSIHNRRRQRWLIDSRNVRGKQWPNRIRELEGFKPFQVITNNISYIENL